MKTKKFHFVGNFTIDNEVRLIFLAFIIFRKKKKNCIRFFILAVVVVSFTYAMLCAIWYHLYNFKNMKNTRAGVLLLVKLQAFSCYFLNKKEYIILSKRNKNFPETEHAVHDCQT